MRRLRLGMPQQAADDVQSNARARKLAGVAVAQIMHAELADAGGSAHRLPVTLDTSAIPARTRTGKNECCRLALLPTPCQQLPGRRRERNLVLGALLGGRRRLRPSPLGQIELLPRRG